MAETTVEVPVFKSGEPGFSVKLNELGDIVRELREAHRDALARIAELARVFHGNGSH
ncbi:hypothetical protein [Glutamicibacter creatinolyticus]|uniref:hypothetical protein n=1 Tax=Glutamicibacter creatinolyticus TaxID=162496 RepID=UPI0032177B09